VGHLLSYVKMAAMFYKMASYFSEIVHNDHERAEITGKAVN
jgi:hypothetical protein